MNPRELGHERLDVYRRSIDFFALATRVITVLPRGNAIIADQLRRAALSIPLNIAEGAGKTRSPDQRHYYAIARGSANECGAILDAIQIICDDTQGLASEGKALLVRIVSMLSRLCRV